MDSFKQVVSNAKCDFVKTVRSAIAWQVSGRFNQWYEEPTWDTANGIQETGDRWSIRIAHDTMFGIEAQLFRKDCLEPEVEYFSFLETESPERAIERVVAFLRGAEQF